MSQFCGYTLELVLNDPGHTTIQGIIKKVVDKKLVVSNPVFLDGTKYGDKDLSIEGSQIKDLKVVELPGKKKKNSKRKNKKQLEKKSKTQTQRNNESEDIVSERRVKSEKPPPHLSRNSSGADWNTESAAEVKQMDDFDFQSNLKKFDKASVFKEISEQDEMDPSERLVNVNKVRPEDKKFANDEMIIQKHNDKWDSVSVKPSKKRSSRNRTPDNRNSDSFIDASDALSSSRSSRIPSRSVTPIRDSLQLAYADNKKVVPTCSALQLSEIENLAQHKFHYSADLLIENSSRELCRLIISKVLGSFRVGSSNNNMPPLVLALVGNNRAGAISIATGRQLLNHNVRVIAYLLHDSEDSEEQIIPEIESNLKIFESCGGKTVKKIDEISSLVSKLDSPLEFILDGLQGYDSDVNDLIEPELSAAKSIINWSNERDVPIMSIDIPSGLNPSSGFSDLGSFLQSKYLVSVGLPLNSILNIYKFGYFRQSELAQYVVDDGLPRKIFRTKSSFRKFENMWFSDKWTRELIIM